MTDLKRISSVIFAFCVLLWFMQVVECTITAEASNTKSAYDRTDDQGLGESASILGSIYHKSRQSRCVTCNEDRGHVDDRSRYYGSYSARSGDDRSTSWYYPSYDRYDDRGYRGAAYDRYGGTGADRYGTDRYGTDRYGTDRYGTDRYGGYRHGDDRYRADRFKNADRYPAADGYAGYRDDRYGARPSYDRYDSRTRDPYERPAAYDRGESRGYGYDNRDRDRYYGNDRESSYYYSRDRYYDRPRYGATGGAGSNTGGYGGYDRDYYDRYSQRGQSGYDDTAAGRGYYNAKGTQEDRRYLPQPSYSSACATRKPNCPEEGTRVASGTIDSGHYNVGVSQTTYNTNSPTNRNESSKGAAAVWSYVRDDERPSSIGSGSGGSGSNNSDSGNRDRNSDRQSSGYGALLDRGSNLIAVEPIKTNENANDDSMPSSDMQNDTNGDETPRQSDNEQNS